MDETIRLVAELDTAGVSSGAQQADRAWTQAVDRMNAGSKSVEAGADRIGLGYQRAAQLGQRAMQAMSAAIGATTAATAAGERQWLALGTVILGSFAAGGPVAGGIALIGAAVGVMAGEAGKAEKAFMANAAAAGKWAVSMGKVRGEALATYIELTKMRGVGRGGMIEDLSDLQRDLGLTPWSDKATSPNAAKEAAFIAAKSEAIAMAQAIELEARAFMRAKEAGAEFVQMLDDINERAERGFLSDEHANRIRDLLGEARLKARTLASFDREDSLLGERDQNEIMGRGLFSGFNRSNELAIEQAIRDQRTKLDRFMREMTDEEIEAQKELISILELRLEIQKQLNDDQVSRLNRGVEREIELLGVRNEKERELLQLRHRGEDLVEGGNDPNAVSRLIEARMQEINSRALVSFLRQADLTLGQGLADIIVDGISNGFRDAADIAELVWRSLLRQMVDDVVQSGLSGALGSLFSGGGGGGGGGGGILGIFGAIAGLFGGGGGGGGGGLGGGGAGVFQPFPNGLSFNVGDDWGPSIGGDPGWEAGPLGMAAGGVVTRPTFTRVGERGPEAVVPLHRMGQMGGGGISISGITVNVQASDVKVAARLAAAEVERAILEKSSTRAAVVRATTRRL